MKSSRIKASRFDKEYKGANGTIFYHTVELENGDKGQVGSKTMAPDFLEVGEVFHYTISSKETQKGTQYVLKRVKPPEAPSGESAPAQTYKGDSRNASMALSYAKDLAVANIAAAREFGSADVLKVAELFKKWLDSNS